MLRHLGSSLIVTIALLLLTVNGALTAEHKSGGLRGMEVWEGKLPGGSVDGKTPREFWNEPGLRSAAERGVGAALVKEITTDETLRHWNVVERYNQTLIASYCVQHNCGFNNIFLFIDMDKGEVSACVHGMNIGASVHYDVHEDYLFKHGHSNKLKYNSCRQIYDSLRSNK